MDGQTHRQPPTDAVLLGLLAGCVSLPYNTHEACHETEKEKLDEQLQRSDRDLLPRATLTSSPAPPPLLSPRAGSAPSGQVVLKTVGLQLRGVAAAALQLGRQGVLDDEGLLLFQAGLEDLLDFVGGAGVVLQEGQR